MRSNVETLYAAIADAGGGGRDGHVLSEGGRIDLDTRPPREMDGTGEGTNPEQLFAATSKSPHYRRLT
jgi:osmotically inducible protein OsmC